MKQPALITAARQEFHLELLARILTSDNTGVPSNADRDNQASIAIARGIAEAIGSLTVSPRLPGQSSGAIFEQVCQGFLEKTFLSLGNLRPGKWSVTRGGRGIDDFEQYQHLDELERITKRNTLLASTLGSDYIIAPDIMIGREPEPDEVINKIICLVDSASVSHSGLRAANNTIPILHASISCKWTMRSDRAQNTRSEALNLVRNRKGHLPHIVVITAEPLPSRLASLALGTGDVDCVYHFALPELEGAVEDQDNSEAQDLLKIMIGGNRLRDISDLPLDLAA